MAGHSSSRCILRKQPQNTQRSLSVCFYIHVPCTKSYPSVTSARREKHKAKASKKSLKGHITIDPVMLGAIAPRTQGGKRTQSVISWVMLEWKLELEDRATCRLSRGAVGHRGWCVVKLPDRTSSCILRFVFCVLCFGLLFLPFLLVFTLLAMCVFDPMWGDVLSACQCQLTTSTYRPMFPLPGGCCCH